MELFAVRSAKPSPTTSLYLLYHEMDEIASGKSANGSIAGLKKDGSVVEWGIPF